MQPASNQPDAHALVVIDMQNAFCSEAGSYWQRGYRIPNITTIKSAVVELVRQFKRRQLPVLCTQMLFESDYRNAGLLLARHPQIRQMGAYQKNTWDSELFDELKEEVTSGCVVIPKTRYDPFLSNEFSDAVSKLSPKGFVVAGVLTNVCVESFVRSAFDRDFSPTVVREATGTYSDELQSASLQTMHEHFADLATLNELCREP